MRSLHFINSVSAEFRHMLKSKKMTQPSIRSFYSTVAGGNSDTSKFIKFNTS